MLLCVYTTTHKKFVVELHPRAKRARGRSPIAKEMWQSTHPRKFGNHVTVRSTVRLRHMETNVYSHTF